MDERDGYVGDGFGRPLVYVLGVVLGAVVGLAESLCLFGAWVFERPLLQTSGAQVVLIVSEYLLHTGSCHTCQLDFCLPAKFQLTYVDRDGSEKTPVVIHRAILGSFERFIGMLTEQYAGKFPTWLAPTQVKVLPVSEKTMDYATDVYNALKAKGVRAVLDDRGEKIGYKIREAQQQKVPYMIIVGQKEAESGTLSIRSRAGEETHDVQTDAFIGQLQEEIRTKAR